MKSLLSIWRYVVNVKSTVKISPIFEAFLENMNFNAQQFLNFSLSTFRGHVRILNAGGL